MRGRAMTASGRSRKAGWIPASLAHSSRVIRDTVSRPVRRTSQNSSTLRAPGNLPAMPMTAISELFPSFDGCIGRPPLTITSSLACLSAVGAAREAGVRPLAGLDDPAQRAHGGSLEQGGHRELHRVFLLEPAHEVDGEKRRSTELEEVVVHAHAIDPEHLSPEGGQPPLDGIVGGDVDRAHL